MAAKRKPFNHAGYAARLADTPQRLCEHCDSVSAVLKSEGHRFPDCACACHVLRRFQADAAAPDEDNG